MLIWGTPSIGETVKQLDSHTPWGHKSSTWGKLCRAYLWKSSPGSPGHHVPLLLYAQHTRGHTDLLLPLQVHKMRAWRTSAPSLGPSLLQRKIHPPRPRVQWHHTCGQPSPPALSPPSLKASPPGTVWPQGTLGIWRHFWLAAPGRRGAVTSSRWQPRVLLNIFKGIAQPLPEQDHLAKMPIAG